LRDRPEDVEPLVAFFLDEFSRTVGKTVEAFAPQAMEVLKAHTWPGNVRELRNLVERVVVLSEGATAGVESLPLQIFDTDIHAKIRTRVEEDLSLPAAVTETEKLCIERALKRAGGKKIEAARLLGISRPTLDKKLKAMGLF
jgi:DNA-binding NtrC family response regulator